MYISICTLVCSWLLLPVSPSPTHYPHVYIFRFCAEQCLHQNAFGLLFYCGAVQDDDSDDGMGDGGFGHGHSNNNRKKVCM